MATCLDVIHNDSSLHSIDDRWSCPLCSFSNSMTNYPICEVCQEVNPEFAENFLITDQSISTWQCSRCTLNNKINAERCRICDTPKHAPVCNKSNIKLTIVLFLFRMTMNQFLLIQQQFLQRCIRH
jgi:ribosomal protein L40E